MRLRHWLAATVLKHEEFEGCQIVAIHHTDPRYPVLGTLDDYVPYMTERGMMETLWLKAKTRVDAMRDEAGKLPAYAWPGGYPMFYTTRDGGVLCPACANGENGSMADDPDSVDDPQWRVVEAGIHYEGEPLTCDHCNGVVASAYGDPDGWEVVVGNVGSVYRGTEAQARQHYSVYVDISKSGVGKAGGEQVTLFYDGEIEAEYKGTLTQE